MFPDCIGYSVLNSFHALHTPKNGFSQSLFFSDIGLIWSDSFLFSKVKEGKIFTLYFFVVFSEFFIIFLSAR